MNPRILIIEDEPTLLVILEAALSFGGFDSHSVGRGRDAMEVLLADSFDAILMDLGLPDIDGIDLLRGLRRITATPIIVVSGRNTEQDKIHALDLGADDFVPKPFMPGELLARIRAVLRRRGAIDPVDAGAADPARPQLLGRLVIDPRDRTVRLDGRSITLTESEFRIFTTLAASPFAPVDRAALLQVLYGPEAARDTKIVEVHIGRIRAKLRALNNGVDLIENLRGRGWLLRPLD